MDDAVTSSYDLEEDIWSEFDLEGNILDFLEWIRLPRNLSRRNMEVDLSAEFAGIPWDINLTHNAVVHVPSQPGNVLEPERFDKEWQELKTSSGFGTMECVLLSVFGTLVTLLFCMQAVVYVRYCTARRQSWSIERNRNKEQQVCLSGRASTLGPDTDATSWAHMYDPYGMVSCKPSLKFSRSRPSGVLYLSDFDSDSPPSDSSVRKGNTIGSRSTFSSTLYMMDHRGHFSPHDVAVTSPEVAMELMDASRVSSRGSMLSVNMAPPIPERNHSSGVRTPLAIPLQCENPAYESDVSTSRSSSTPYGSSKSASPISPLTLGAPSPTSPLTLDLPSDDSSFTSVSSLSDLSAPALLASYSCSRNTLTDDHLGLSTGTKMAGCRPPAKSVSFSGFHKHQPLGSRPSSASSHANIYKCKIGYRR